jgi:hypothetical protein
MMSEFYRKPRYDITELHTARLNIVLDVGQTFFETPKAYEIWQDVRKTQGGSFYSGKRIKRIPKKQVLWEFV